MLSKENVEIARRHVHEAKDRVRRQEAILSEVKALEHGNGD